MKEEIQKKLQMVVQAMEQQGIPQEKAMAMLQQEAQKQGVQSEEQMSQFLDSIIQQLQGSAQQAKMGAKLNYIKRLNGICPDGYEVATFKKGGKVCGCKKKK